MPALDGAIERIALGESGAVETRVIGDGPAEGICGSGLVDLLGELRRTEGMNVLGRLQGGDGRFTVDETRDLSLLESDISELAQAKGANVAGLRIVLAAVRHRRATTWSGSTWPAGSPATSTWRRRGGSA